MKKITAYFILNFAKETQNLFPKKDNKNTPVIFQFVTVLNQNLSLKKFTLHIDLKKMYATFFLYIIYIISESVMSIQQRD